MIEINSENIAEVMDGKIVVIDFWADWCGPCKAIAPVFEKIAEENSNADVSFVKCNIEDGPDNYDLCQKLGVRSVPSFTLAKDGELVKSVVGTMDEEKLSLAIEDMLKLV